MVQEETNHNITPVHDKKNESDYYSISVDSAPLVVNYVVPEYSLVPVGSLLIICYWEWEVLYLFI